MAAGRGQPSFARACAYWLRFGLISFGGAAGQIGILQTDLVDRRGWIDQQTFLNGLSFAMLLPGPEAQQLAIYLGWRLNGVAGGIAAGTLFLIPGAALMAVLAWIAAAHGEIAVVAELFGGLQAVVIGIILAAMISVARRAFRDWTGWAMAAAAFLALVATPVPFPAVILGAGTIGLLVPRFAPPASAEPPAELDGRALVLRVLRLAGLYAALLIAPVAALIAVVGAEPFLALARFFTGAAFVTFGGAYAVLPYVAEAAVDTHGWITAEQMVTGLALAESTPGPTILVNQFVGFLAGFAQAADLAPLAGGLLGGGLVLYVTFLPCYFFIFAGAPYIETLAANRRVAGGLAAITAAVVGVVAALALFLGRTVLWDGNGDWVAAALAGAAFAALHWRVAGVLAVVAAGAAAGLLRFAIGV